MGQNAAGAANIDAQVEMLADSGAHVLVLQEITVTAQGNQPALFEAKLEALTGQQWQGVWAPAPWSTTTTQEGNLILTTLPIASSSTFTVDTAPWDSGWFDTKRSAARLAVVVNDGTVNVFGTHLALNATHRQSQLDALQAWIDGFAAPRIIGGDFNMVPGETAYIDMAAMFTDAWTSLAGSDQGFTMDARNSAGNQPGRIDYWWQEKADSQALGSEVWVVKTTRSDHHIVVLDVQVK
ncbi:MAG: endonuclease/exonuclease/phosphatase family protein, partial [Acidobacteria bacterium]|nr:endonuclease/exonuclease/phosphatase family protein [Acidobacteriota bacterium]